MLISFTKLVNKYTLKITGVSHFGAHKGQEVKSYKENGINNIHLFEPQTNVFEFLSYKFQDVDGINLYNFGLGDSDESMMLNLEKNNDGMSSSILQPLEHKKYYPDIEFNETEQVHIKRYEDLGITNVNFLNIDIQGFELEALKGCGDKLSKIDYIYIEINRKELYLNNPHVSEIDNYLRNYDFLRVKTIWASSNLPFGDALYIKKENLSKKYILLCNMKSLFWSTGLFYIFIDFFRTIKKFLIKIRNYLKTIV